MKREERKRGEHEIRVFLISWFEPLLARRLEQPVSRLSVPLKGRASGPSGHFAQPRLIGYSGPPTGRPALHHWDLPAPSSLVLLLLAIFFFSSFFFFVVVFLSISVYVPVLSLSLFVLFRLVSRFVELTSLAIDDDSTLSLTVNRESRDSRERSTGCCETTA